MTAPIRDYRSLLRQAIAEARTCGLAAETDQLEQATSAAYTTSSELLGEQGEAILQFLKATRGRLPAGVKDKLAACLAEIGKTWPVYRRFVVWVYCTYMI